MTKTGHQITGLCGALAAMTFYQKFDHAWMVAVGIWLGCAAPDWLEIAHYDGKRGHRTSLIEHRTITHWLPPWILLVAYSWWQAEGNPWFLVALGFGIGGLIHLAVDLPNPTGIPLLFPTRGARVSLNLWRSGENEWVIVLAFFLVVLGLYSFNFGAHFFGMALPEVG